MNGWQRIWFVGTVVGLLWAAVYGFVKGHEYSPVQTSILEDTEVAASKASCADFVKLPFASLAEPTPANHLECWALWNVRRYMKDNAPPFTVEKYRQEIAQRKLETSLEIWGVLTAVVVVVSALVYFSGVVLAWIIRGFRKPPISSTP